MSPESVLVLVPSYNHGKFIADRIHSILNQSHQNFELYVIDDCSTDKTMEVLGRFRDPRLTVVRRDKNSGSPFTAWFDANEIIRKRKFDYIWIAESDDRADSKFLETALRAFLPQPDASLYFCHSWFIDEHDFIIGHSINYLNRVFPSTNWSHPLYFSGPDFIRQCLIYGMAIPNMSSAVIRSEAFSSAVCSTFQRYKLAADWVFAIEAALRGGAIFDPWDGNYFRHHDRTSRSETHSSRMLFEHMSATRRAYLSGCVGRGTYLEQMRTLKGMYRDHGTALKDFVRWGAQISPADLAASLYQLAVR